MQNSKVSTADEINGMDSVPRTVSRNDAKATLLKASQAAEGVDDRFRRGEGSKTVVAYAHDDLLEKRRPVM